MATIWIFSARSPLPERPALRGRASPLRPPGAPQSRLPHVLVGCLARPPPRCGREDARGGRSSEASYFFSKNPSSH
eukprot:scaffold258_cov354-Prasinococcus_capsulatus_cf.AAC.1